MTPTELTTRAERLAEIIEREVKKQRKKIAEYGEVGIHPEFKAALPTLREDLWRLQTTAQALRAVIAAKKNAEDRSEELQSIMEGPNGVPFNPSAFEIALMKFIRKDSAQLQNIYRALQTKPD